MHNGNELKQLEQSDNVLQLAADVRTLPVERLRLEQVGGGGGAEQHAALAPQVFGFHPSQLALSFHILPLLIHCVLARCLRICEHFAFGLGPQQNALVQPSRGQSRFGSFILLLSSLQDEIQLPSSS